MRRNEQKWNEMNWNEMTWIKWKGIQRDRCNEIRYCKRNWWQKNEKMIEFNNQIRCLNWLNKENELIE